MNMLDPGDVVSLGIPCLIWIQLLVLFLLIALLLCFSFFPLDDSSSAAVGPTDAAAAESASTSRFIFDDIRQIDKPNNPKHHSDSTNFLIHRTQDPQGGDNRSIKGEVSAGTTRRVVSAEDYGEREGSSRFHPCHYFQLARVAFLKCLGLDPASDSPPPQKRRKPKQS